MIDILDFKGVRVHMIGIGGSSMSGLAEMLLHEGYTLTGSDNTHSHAVERLEKEGIHIQIGHRAENVHGAALIIFSAAILPDNPERQEAARLGIPEMERSVLLGQLMRFHRHAVCVSGAHGKATTSAMIAQILLDCGLDPAVSIGGRLDAIGGGSRDGGREVFVAEACEYHSSFLEMHPTLAVVLNIDEDHLDYYGDIEHIEKAFGDFLSLVPPTGTALGWGDDPRVQRLFSSLGCRTLFFGDGEECDFRTVNMTRGEHGNTSFDVSFRGRILGHVDLKVVGDKNRLDALAAFAAAYLCGADAGGACASLSSFAGAHRRFEKTGVIDGVSMYHDYGHNPAEMRIAVHNAVMQRPHAVWAVVQPHTYSRVITLFDAYLTCTEEADHTLVTDICAAREKDPGTINSAMLVEGMRKNGIDAVLTPSFDDCEKYLRSHWQPGDLVITMGCGDINLLNEQMHTHGDTK